MNRDNQNIIQSNAGLVADVRDMIKQTRSGVAHTVNTGMTFLFWRTGKRIQMEVLKYERAEYGGRIIATLSQELSAELGRGYSYSALTRMVKYHEAAPDEEIVAALRRQSPIRFARIRTMESSDNRPISRSESSDQTLESSEIVRSGPINYQRRFISRKTMAGTWLSSQPEGRETDNTLRAILEKIGI